MRITWDPKKAEINFKKHNVRFSDAELVLYDPFALTLEEPSIHSLFHFPNEKTRMGCAEFSKASC